MLILASQSPRRAELLRNAGISFEVRPAEVGERPRANEPPLEYVQRLAKEKALAVLATASPGALVLGADTAVVVEGEVLGKPADAADARRMLSKLSGRTHEVMTGVCLAWRHPSKLRSGSLGTPRAEASGVTASAAGVDWPDVDWPDVDWNVECEVEAEVTEVEFAPLSEDEIAAYVATGEPMDKAGAYAIQGRASRWIPRIHGCYFNVVGLPVARVCAMLLRARYGG
jgi:septum formation protein